MPRHHNFPFADSKTRESISSRLPFNDPQPHRRRKPNMTMIAWNIAARSMHYYLQLSNCLQSPPMNQSGRLPLPFWQVPAAGDWIGGAREVVGEIGSGALGEVLLAVDQQLDHKMAIKLIHSWLCNSDFRERFLRQARALAQLSYPNVLGIYAFGQHGLSPYFVTELVEGTTLSRRIAEQGAFLDLDLAFRILYEICAAVQAIHHVEGEQATIARPNVCGQQPSVFSLRVRRLQPTYLFNCDAPWSTSARPSALRSSLPIPALTRFLILSMTFSVVPLARSDAFAHCHLALPALGLCPRPACFCCEVSCQCHS